MNGCGSVTRGAANKKLGWAQILAPDICALKVAVNIFIVISGLSPWVFYLLLFCFFLKTYYDYFEELLDVSHVFKMYACLGTILFLNKHFQTFTSSHEGQHSNKWQQISQKTAQRAALYSVWSQDVILCTKIHYWTLYARRLKLKMIPRWSNQTLTLC